MQCLPAPYMESELQCYQRSVRPGCRLNISSLGPDGGLVRGKGVNYGPDPENQFRNTQNRFESTKVHNRKDWEFLGSRTSNPRGERIWQRCIRSQAWQTKRITRSARRDDPRPEQCNHASRPIEELLCCAYLLLI